MVVVAGFGDSGHPQIGRGPDSRRWPVCERSDDVCSCSFTDSLPAVAEYCGSDAASVDRAVAEVVANVTAVVRQVVDATPFCDVTAQTRMDVCS